MTINHTKRTIEMTETEAKQRSKYGSDEYNALVKAMQDFPTYSITTIKRKNKQRTDSLKGLTYEYMKTYISKHGTEKQSEEFDMLFGTVDGLKHISPSYGKVKKWFLSQFPEIMGYHKKIEEILTANIA